MIDISDVADKEVVFAEEGKIMGGNFTAANTVFMWDSNKKTPMFLCECNFSKDFCTEFETTLFHKCVIVGKIIVKSTVQGIIIMDRFTADHLGSTETENVESISVISDLAMERLFHTAQQRL